MVSDLGMVGGFGFDPLSVIYISSIYLLKWIQILYISLRVVLKWHDMHKITILISWKRI